MSIDGTADSFTIVSGTYTAQQLADAVSTASGGLLTAQVDNTGQLVLATAEQGSNASLQIGAGSANGVLGVFSAGGAVNGTDGVITVDGQANTGHRHRRHGHDSCHPPAPARKARCKRRSTRGG